MGGKGKHKGKHNHRSNHNQQQQHHDSAPRLSEDDICELVAEATDLHTLLNARHQQLKKVEGSAHILSIKWLREWKDYVGYDNLFSDDDSKSKKKVGKKRPGPPNTDLISSTKQYFVIPEEELPQYAYLNKVLNEKLSIDEDFIAIPPELWNRFDAAYGPGVEIRRPVRKLKSGKNFVDGSLLKADFIFIDYQNPNLLQKLKEVKNPSAKFLQELLPSNSLQMSTLWTLQDLYRFLGEYSQVVYGSGEVSVWRCENFIGLKSLQEQFGKSVKDGSYQVYAYKLQIDDEALSELDLDDFIKAQYTLIVEVGDSKIKSAPLPDEIQGYCEECVEKRVLKFGCECERVHYCSLQCRTDDQVWHFKSCKHSFDSDDDELYKKKKGLKASCCGLKNLGNTCYMNSSIQLFLSLKFITNTLCEGDPAKIVDQNEEDGLMLLQKVSKVCKQMGEVEKLGFLAPWSLKSQINYFLPPFKGYKQHDAIDFLSGFLNTLNECLAKPKDQAYSTLFRQNIMGQFDSLVICPECDSQVNNVEDFMQVTLPIKPKANRIFYNYVKFESPLQYSYGRAEAFSSWQNIRNSVGVENGLIMLGRDGEEELMEMDMSEDSEKAIKKTKKDILFFPNEHYDPDGQIWINCSFVILKTLCGEQMKAISGYPFPLIVPSNLTVGHIFIMLVRKFYPDSPQTASLSQLEEEYDKIVSLAANRIAALNSAQENQKMEQSTVSSAQSKESEVKPEDGQREQDKIEAEVKAMMSDLNIKAQELLKQLGVKVFVEDKKRIKNVCSFCKKKCKGCDLEPLFEWNVVEFFSHKLRDAKLNIFLEKKLEAIKQKVDLADNGDTTLQDCLALFGEPEQLDQENAWWCSTCEDMRLAYKQIHIRVFPKYFLIQLSRFKNGANGKVKNNEPVSYQEYEKFGGAEYRLMGAIVHQGSIEGGHYWAIGLREEAYYIFNDEKVSKTEKVCNKGAYILCYRRE